MEKIEKNIWWMTAGIFLLLSLSISAGLYFREPWLWMDEVLSYLLIADPSPTHLNNAIVSNMDANPPLFPNFYWLIGHVASLSPLFLRIVSVLLFAGTIALFFRYTTRLIGDGVTNFVLISAITYFTYQNFAHATGIRSYAVLLPLSCLYFITIHQLISDPASRRWLVLHTLIGTLMVFCHNYGLFYLAASGAFFGLLLLWSKQRNYWLVLVSFGLIMGIWLVTWYPSFAIQSNAGKPHSWIPLPTVRSVFAAIGELIPSPSVSDRLNRLFSFAELPFLILRVGIVIGLYIYIAVVKLKGGFQVVRQDRAFQFFLMSGFIYLTTILIALLISLVYTSVFISRYMWPSQLLITYQLVYTYYYFVGQSRTLPRLARLLPLYSFLLGGVIFYKVWKMQSPFPSRILDYLPQLSEQYPVFVETADYFLPIWFHKQRSNISFLLNWNTADRPNNIRSATVYYKIMTSLKDKYHVSGIVSSGSFNPAHFPHFYVVDEQAVYQIEDFIKNGQVKVIREYPIAMSGHRLLECTFNNKSL